MTRDNHVCGLPDSMCDTECMENAYRPPSYCMVVQLRFDRESFDALKELLRKESRHVNPRSVFVANGATSDALRRVFDQIRDVSYDDGT
jgi:hypothetical protein